MMETLRIKCPSCGVILEVKNSKQETVKKISCPNCHKRLAVTFGDIPTPKPAPVFQPIGTLYEGTASFPLLEGANLIPNVPDQLAEISVIRLMDGSCKHVLRTLSTEQPLSVNGQIQQEGDEIVLSSGDEFEIEGHMFSFDKPGKPKIDKAEAEPDKIEPTRKPFNGLLKILLLFALIGGCVLCLFWPNHHEETPLVAEAEDSVIVQQDTVQPKKTASPQKTKVKSNDKATTIVDDDDYALDIQATKGNVKAQYKLGMRWVTSNDCSQVLKGVRYLETAARNGSTDAQYALGIIFYKGSPSCGINRNTDLSFQYMHQAASNGNAKARRFIESHQEE